MNRAAHLLSQLSAAIQERLDDPKNAQKGDWIGYSRRKCLMKLGEELMEFLWELWLIPWFKFIDDLPRMRMHRRAALSEFADVCVCGIMILNVWGVIKDENSS